MIHKQNSFIYPDQNHTYTASSKAQVSTVIENINIVINIFGKKWVQKRIIKLQKENQSLDKLMKEKKLYLKGYRHPRHPIINLLYNAMLFTKDSKHQTNDPTSLSKLEYIVLVLGKVKKMNGFNKYLDRLKNIDHYEAYFFELEVALYYILKGMSVEFIEEGNTKTPDLKVRYLDFTFWVECKSRYGFSKSEKNNMNFWNKLEPLLLKNFGNNKINVAIIIHALEKPKIEDIQDLSNYIFHLVETDDIGFCDIKSGKYNTKKDPTGKYEIAIERLTDIDEKIYRHTIEYNEKHFFDGYLFSINQEAYGTYVTNPIFIAYKYERHIDKISGLLNGLSSAAKQIPPKGPSVVWIRIPDNMLKNKTDTNLEEVISRIKNELRGDNYTRINEVVITSNYSESNIITGKNIIKFAPTYKSILHINPNKPFPTFNQIITEHNQDYLDRNYFKK